MIRAHLPLSRLPVMPMLTVPLALLAGCGSPTPVPAATNAAAPADTTAASIRTLPDGQRTAVFLRAIRDAGHDCQGVTKSAEVTANGSPPTWQATCQDGAQWLVAIGLDGAATVTSRAALDEGGGAG